MQFNDSVFIEAIKRSKSPKLAYNGAKALYEGVSSFKTVGDAVLEVAWEDAKKFNKANERRKGRLKRPSRYSLDGVGLDAEVKRITEAGDRIAELGRVLIEIDEAMLKDLWLRISHLFD